MCDVIVVCAFPYIIAFTGDMIEIRLLINGNLVHSMAMPHLQLITAKVRALHSRAIRGQGGD